MNKKVRGEGVFSPSFPLEKNVFCFKGELKVDNNELG